jgi:hypothetical protein
MDDVSLLVVAALRARHARELAEARAETQRVRAEAVRLGLAQCGACPRLVGPDERCYCLRTVVRCDDCRVGCAVCCDDCCDDCVFPCDDCERAIHRTCARRCDHHYEGDFCDGCIDLCPGCGVATCRYCREASWLVECGCDF